MSEDFQGHTAAPGLEGVNLTTRAWLEHRSRVQQFAGPVRWGWQTAGALDALLAGREEECKARLCLMLCALDQSALDGGSWLLASEMLLESPPPLSSFSKHRSPEPGESHQTKVMDPRWISLLMHRIRERESFIEARKKLSAPRGPSAPNPDAERDKPEKPSKGPGEGEGDGVNVVQPDSANPIFIKNSSEPAPPLLPGAQATAVHGSTLWNQFFETLGRAKTPLSSFWHSLRIASPGAQSGPKGRVWPMPMPFPSLHRRSARRQQPDVCRKLALNATILVSFVALLGSSQCCA